MSSNQRYVMTPLTAAIAAALAPVHSASAQEQGSEQDSSRVLEEVIVTASRRGAMNMQDLPQSIQAFDNEAIIRNNFINFTDVSRAIPSLSVVSDQPGRNSVKFRGISTGTQEFYTDALVAIYFDETPLTFNSQQLWPEMVDVERIESLPGPQGTLFGSSSQGGTLRVVTNKPDPTSFYGEVFGQYFATEGGDGSYNANGFVNIPLIQDTLALRVVGYYRKEGGWIDNVPGQAYVIPAPGFSFDGTNAPEVESDQNVNEVTGGRAALRWDISDDWSATVSMVGEQAESDGSWYQDPSVGEDQVILFTDEFRNDEWYNATLLIEGDLGFADLVSSTTYLDREISYEFDNMIYEQWKDSFFGVYYGFALYNSEYTVGAYFNDQTQDRFSQEIRLTSSSDSRFQWMVGGFYEKVNDDWLYGANNPDLVDTLAWYYANYLAYYYNALGYDVQYPLTPTDLAYTNRLDRTITQTAVFGEISYDVTDKWSANLGVRWFEFERDYREQNKFPEGLPPFGQRTDNSQGIVEATSKDSDTVFKFSTQYNIDDDKMVYALWSQGFRLGGENTRRAAETGLVPSVYEPDFLDNYELGLKSEWLDNSLQFNATLFYMEWDNYHFSEGGVDGQWWLRGTVNGGTVEQKGVEMNAIWQATDNLRLEATATLTDPEVTEQYTFLDGDTLEKGDPLPNSPKRSYFVAARLFAAHAGAGRQHVGAPRLQLQLQLVEFHR